MSNVLSNLVKILFQKRYEKSAFSRNFNVEMWITWVDNPIQPPKFPILHKNKLICIIIYLWKCG